MDVADPSSLGDCWIQRTDPQFLILVRKQIIITMTIIKTKLLFRNNNYEKDLLQKLLKISSTSALGGLLLDVWGLGAGGAGGGQFPLTLERNGMRLRARGAETRPVPDGQTTAARAGLCVPGRGQWRSRGSEPTEAPRMPRARGAWGQLLSGGSAGWEPAVPWTRAPCAMGCPSTYEPFWCWGSYAHLVPRGCPSRCPWPSRAGGCG